MPKKKRKPTGLQPVRLDDQEPGTRRDFLLPIYQKAIGTAVECPFIVLRGAEPGPVVGICAAIHGNELNGINIIHQLLEAIDPGQLAGTILFAPVANVPAFEAEQRHFPEDGKDLNTVFPGKRGGTPSQQYARAFKKLERERRLVPGGVPHNGKRVASPPGQSERLEHMRKKLRR